MRREADVAIIGGGIAGLTLATSLFQKSISVQVFEQGTELREIGAGVALGGNATRLLQVLGIDLRDIANVPPTFEIRRWSDGDILWSHPIGAWYRETVGAPYLTIHRATLQRLLAEGVPGDCVQLGHRLIGLADASSRVHLQFENGTEAVARVVAAADGIHSVARQYVCGKVLPILSGEIGFRGVIPVGKSPDLPMPQSLHVWCGPATHVVYYGLDRGELVNLLAVYRPDRLPEWTESTTRIPGDRNEALGIFECRRWDPRILDLVRHIEGDMSFWALMDLPRLPRWSRGRVLLLGDAAHAPLPHQGQGAGQAIEDSYTLGVLIGELGLQTYSRVFDLFERLRRGRTRKVQAYSRLSGRAFKLVGDAAVRRDQSWPSLSEHIAWIHGHRMEEVLRSASASW